MSPKAKQYTLAPFNEAAAKNINFLSIIRRENLKINSSFTLTGNIKNILLPPLSPHPERMGGLWESTCFEIFLKNTETDFYLEFNLAPSGNWNCFSFNGYRAGMREYEDLKDISISFSQNETQLKLDATIELNDSNYFRIEDFKSQEIKASLCAVIENNSFEKSFWAIKHHTNKPDFHLSDNFTIPL